MILGKIYMQYFQALGWRGGVGEEFTEKKLSLGFMVSKIKY